MPRVFLGNTTQKWSVQWMPVKDMHIIAPYLTLIKVLYSVDHTPYFISRTFKAICLDGLEGDALKDARSHHWDASGRTLDHLDGRSDEPETWHRYTRADQQLSSRRQKRHQSTHRRLDRRQEYEETRHHVNLIRGGWRLDGGFLDQRYHPAWHFVTPYRDHSAFAWRRRHSTF